MIDQTKICCMKKKLLPKNTEKSCIYFLKTSILLLLLFASKVNLYSQDAFMGYNYVTTTIPTAWSATPVVYNASTNKEVSISGSSSSQIKSGNSM